MRFGTDTGSPYMLAALSGNVAAALAQDAIIFHARANAQPSGLAALTREPLQVDGLYLAFSTIAAFTVPIVAGRQIGVYKATGAIPTTGTVVVPVPKRTSDAGANNGLEAAKIAAAAGLTPGAAYVRQANPIVLLDLTAFGAAGARVEKYYSLLDQDGAPLILDPGESLVVSNPVAMDAGGTFQLLVELAYRRRGD